MAALRGRILSIVAHDLDGQLIEPQRRNRPPMPVETITLTILVDYADGDLLQLLGASLAIAPHEQHQRELARMRDQRDERRPTPHLEVDRACRRCGNAILPSKGERSLVVEDAAGRVQYEHSRCPPAGGVAVPADSSPAATTSERARLFEFDDDK